MVLFTDLFRVIGDIFFIGDLNCRVGENPDVIENINLDRYVDLPDGEDLNIPPRVSQAYKFFWSKIIKFIKRK
jgi:hypothetical protein